MASTTSIIGTYVYGVDREHVDEAKRVLSCVSTNVVVDDKEDHVDLVVKMSNEHLSMINRIFWDKFSTSRIIKMPRNSISAAHLLVEIDNMEHVLISNSYQPIFGNKIRVLGPKYLLDRIEIPGK